MESNIKIKPCSTSSIESNYSNLNPETLDKLYKNQLHVLRELVLRLVNTDDIELCRKWLKIFTKTSENEKLARNCLCTLMQEQLEEFGYLSEPFTDITNCNRHLDHVLREIDEPIEICSEDHKTFTSHRYTNDIISEKSSDYMPEWQENEMLAENALLKREIDALRLKLTEKHIENAKLKEKNEAIETENREKNNNDIKTILAISMREIIADLENNPNKFPENIFERIFHELKDSDQEFYHDTVYFGAVYETTLLKWVENDVENTKNKLATRFYKKYNRTKLRLKEKYERRLNVTNWAQLLQLKLVKLKCYSTLRNIFMNLDKNNKGKVDINMWDIMKKLEEKYQSVVNEMI